MWIDKMLNNFPFIYNRTEFRPGKEFRVAGSIMETWKTGWIECMLSGRWRVNKWVPAWVMMVKGSRNFSESFFDGLVVQMWSDFTNTLSPIRNSGAGIRWQLAEAEYRVWAVEMVFWSWVWSSSRSVTKFLAVDKSKSWSRCAEMLGWYPYWRKWRDSSGSIRGVIISKFGDGEQIWPIVLLVVAVYSEVLLQGLIRLFGLSVAFGMITTGEVELHVQDFP